jgi:antitoxin ParD1/3/4
VLLFAKWLIVKRKIRREHAYYFSVRAVRGVGYRDYGAVANVLKEWQTLPIYFALRTSMATMNISLTPQLEKLVQERVKSGRYTSASEVIREALRLMDEKDQLLSAKLEHLRQDIREGLESGPATVWDPEEIKRAGRARRATQKSDASA